MITSAPAYYSVTGLEWASLMDRLKTYVEGFDEALGGGIPRGSLVLVAGTPGTMKTALTFSILYENVKAGSKALYITLEESQEDLRAAMTDLGMTGLDDMELYVLDVGRIRLEHKDDELSKNWLDVLQKYIEQRVQMNGFDLLALDSLAALYSLSRLSNPRRELFHFFGFLKSLKATCFLISELPSGNDGRLSVFDEEFLADGILFLRHFEKGETDVQLRLRCVKMRRARHERGYYTLTRNDGRFQITRAISE
jgi:KaiC/GvpD/RAD55 family RecA-like ATPase